MNIIDSDEKVLFIIIFLKNSINLDEISHIMVIFQLGLKLCVNW